MDERYDKTQSLEQNFGRMKQLWQDELVQPGRVELDCITLFYYTFICYCTKNETTLTADIANR